MGESSHGTTSKPVHTDRESAVVDPQDIPESFSDEPIGGVVLAAGTSTRFGSGNKLLAAVNGEAIVRRATRTLTESALDEVVVVVGHDGSQVAAAVDDLPVTVVRNEEYEHGQSTSLHRGVETARERGWAAVVFGLGDMPAVASESVDLLLRAYAAGVGAILPAAFEGTRANPVLFDASTFDDLLAVDGDTGGRPVLAASDDVALIETRDPGVRRDVDFDEDVEQFQ